MKTYEVKLKFNGYFIYKVKADTPEDAQEFAFADYEAGFDPDEMLEGFVGFESTREVSP